eukprot:UN22234
MKLGLLLLLLLPIVYSQSDLLPDFESFSGYPLTCPEGFKVAKSEKVSNTDTFTISVQQTTPVAFIAGSTDGSTMEVDCGIASFKGNGYMKWGPLVYGYG